MPADFSKPISKTRSLTVSRLVLASSIAGSRWGAFERAPKGEGFVQRTRIVMTWQRWFYCMAVVSCAFFVGCKGEGFVQRTRIVMTWQW